MELNPELLNCIACPQCRGDLRLTREEVLFCLSCRVCYPIENGVPQLYVEAALPLNAQGEITPREEIAFFKIASPDEEAQHFRLEMGSCKIIGKYCGDDIPGQIYNWDFTLSLEPHTQQVILNYLSQILKQDKYARKTEGDLGPFRRLSDLLLDDPALSRLQAMVFNHSSGAGVIDLVSRTGTFVNGKEVEAACLKPNDVIRMGNTTMTLVCFQ